jgi:hypothetical protein
MQLVLYAVLLVEESTGIVKGTVRFKPDDARKTVFILEGGGYSSVNLIPMRTAVGAEREISRRVSTRKPMGHLMCVRLS